MYEGAVNDYRDLYKQSLKDQTEQSDQGEKDRVAYSELESKYGRLKSDYDDARREADSYFTAQRDDETSRLRSGFTVGGFPGSRRTDLKSGSTATSDRSRKRSFITAGPKVKDDRPYAREGLRKGSDTGSTYFDSESSFR